MVGWGESCCSDFVRCVRSSWLGFFSSSSSFPGGSLPTRDELPWRSSYNSERTERESVAVIAACMLLCVTASIICSLNLRFG